MSVLEIWKKYLFSNTVLFQHCASGCLLPISEKLGFRFRYFGRKDIYLLVSTLKDIYLPKRISIFKNVIDGPHCISSREQNYFALFAMRYPVWLVSWRLKRCIGSGYWGQCQTEKGDKTMDRTFFFYTG
jgi:hypothetical protein